MVRKASASICTRFVNILEIAPFAQNRTRKDRDPSSNLVRVVFGIHNSIHTALATRRPDLLKTNTGENKEETSPVVQDTYLLLSIVL